VRGLVLGGTSFVSTVLPGTETEAVAEMQIDFAELVRRVTELFAVTVEDLCSRRRTKVLTDARALLCALAMEYLQMTGARLAENLKLARSSICRAERRGRVLLAEQPVMREILLGR